MINYLKYDRVITGFITGALLPFLVGLIIYAFSPGDMSLYTYLSRLASSDIITHSISICVFPNVLIFLLFNRLDMLRAARGTLAVTIVWAIIVFGVKFSG